jgi:cytochrome oxidase assembly protein ShyY1
MKKWPKQREVNWKETVGEAVLWILAMAGVVAITVMLGMWQITP